MLSLTDSSCFQEKDPNSNQTMYSHGEVLGMMFPMGIDAGKKLI
jgi:hypothetical protein